jgi:hypothetical protein
MEAFCPFFIEFLDKKAGTVAEFLTLWIENSLIPYWTGGNTHETHGKEGLLAQDPAARLEKWQRGRKDPACE